MAEWRNLLFLCGLPKRMVTTLSLTSHADVTKAAGLRNEQPRWGAGCYT